MGMQTYRARLTARGMARFEVLGLNSDRELIRSLARRLAENSPKAARVRETIARSVSAEPPIKGGILKALRRSPLVGSELDLARSGGTGRSIDL